MFKQVFKLIKGYKHMTEKEKDLNTIILNKLYEFSMVWKKKRN